MPDCMSAWLAHAEDAAKGDLGEVAIGTDEQRGYLSAQARVDLASG